MNILGNRPFIFGVATSGDNFTYREKETERLLQNFKHGVNTVLISSRRWGKTSLMQKACRLAQSDKLKIVYHDIFSCRSDRDFYMADFSISPEMRPKSNDFDEILQFSEKIAQKKGCNIVVCIDEFQQIAEFKDSKTFPKRLRSVWQLHESVSYCRISRRPVRILSTQTRRCSRSRQRALRPIR